MTALTIMTTPEGGKTRTMSSREIAELTGKRHDHVMRDIRKMLADLNAPNSGAADFAASYTDAKGETRECFHLPRRECLILVSGYDVGLRAKIIDRWEALESEKIEGSMDLAAALAIALADPIQARGLLTAQVERNMELQGQIEEMRPQVQALDRIAASEGTFCITDAAKTLQVQPKALFTFLRAHRWIYTRAGTSNEIAYQDKLATGLLEHKTTTVYRSDGSEKTATQVRVTAKGLAHLAKVFPPTAGIA